MKRKNRAQMDSEIIDEERSDMGWEENVESSLENTLATFENDPMYAGYFSSSSGNPAKIEAAGLPVPGNLYSPKATVSLRNQMKKWLNDGMKARILTNLDVMTVPEIVTNLVKYHFGMKVEAPSFQEFADRKCAKLGTLTSALEADMDRLREESRDLANYKAAVVGYAKKHNDELDRSKALRRKYQSDIERISLSMSGVPLYSDARIDGTKLIIYAQEAEKEAVIDSIMNLHARNLREMELDKLTSVQDMITATRIGISTSVVEGRILYEHIQRTLKIYGDAFKAVEDMLEYEKCSEKTRKDLSTYGKLFHNGSPLLYNKIVQSLTEEGSNLFLESRSAQR
jgi:hypothetical protein